MLAKIDPELIRRLACPFIWLGSSDPANPKIERLEGTDGVYRRLSQCSSSPRSTVTAVPAHDSANPRETANCAVLVMP